MKPFGTMREPHPDAVKRWERLNELTKELKGVEAKIERLRSRGSQED